MEKEKKVKEWPKCKHCGKSIYKVAGSTSGNWYHWDTPEDGHIAEPRWGKTKCIHGRQRHYWGRNGKYFSKCFYCGEPNPNPEQI